MGRIQEKHVKRYFVFSSIFLLLFIGLIPLLEIGITHDSYHVKTSLIHPKIYINGESALDSFPNKTGSGTEYDPYVIANYEIDAGGVGSAIEIRNIFNRYLVLDGINVTNSGSSDYDAGIELLNCRNLVVKNCIATDNNCGMCIGISINCEFYGNIFSDNLACGLYVYDGNTYNISIYNNNFNQNICGIDFDGGTNSSVFNNGFTVYSNQQGVELSETTRIKIMNNVFYLYGEAFGINIIECFSTEIRNNSIHSSAGGFGIRLDSSLYNTVVENTINSCLYGVSVSLRGYNVIDHNTILGCIYGIYLEFNGKNKISYNLIIENNIGVLLNQSSHNSFSRNRFKDNFLDYEETDSHDNGSIVPVPLYMIIFWSSLGVFGLAGVTFISIILPKKIMLYKSNRLLKRGEILKNEEKFEQAIQCFDSILEKDPHNESVLNKKIAILYELKRFNEISNILHDNSINQKEMKKNDEK